MCLTKQLDMSKTSVEISTDKSQLDVDCIHKYLSERSYWAKGRTKAEVEATIDNSMCFGLYINGELAAFTRLVTDLTCFAYLMDLFVLEQYRGKGCSKRLLEFVFSYPTLQTVSFLLRTSDATELYKQFGFKAIDQKNDFMRRAPTSE